MARRDAGQRNRPNPAGTTDYDLLAKLINDAIDARLGELQPRMGTVKIDGDKRVRVQFDDSPDDEDSGEGHGHGGGKKRKGDRVVMIPVGEGNYVAVGPIMEDGRRNREMIGSDEIEKDAIDGGHLKENAIQKKHLPKNIIGRNELENKAITNDHLDDNFRNDLARKGHIDNVNKRIDGVGSRMESLQRRLKALDGKD